jgi:hypothetical protein
MQGTEAARKMRLREETNQGAQRQNCEDATGFSRLAVRIRQGILLACYWIGSNVRNCIMRIARSMLEMNPLARFAGAKKYYSPVFRGF